MLGITLFSLLCFSAINFHTHEFCLNNSRVIKLMVGLVYKIPKKNLTLVLKGALALREKGSFALHIWQD